MILLAITLAASISLNVLFVALYVNESQALAAAYKYIGHLEQSLADAFDLVRETLKQ